MVWLRLADKEGVGAILCLQEDRWEFAGRAYVRWAPCSTRSCQPFSSRSPSTSVYSEPARAEGHHLHCGLHAGSLHTSHAGVIKSLRVCCRSDMEWFSLDINPVLQRCKERGDIEHIRFRIHDFDGFDLRLKLPEAVSIVAERINAGRKVYIHCTAGIVPSGGLVLSLSESWDAILLRCNSHLVGLGNIHAHSPVLPLSHSDATSARPAS